MSQAHASWRNPAIDALKGFLIILVVLGHTPLSVFFSDAPGSAQAAMVENFVSFLDIYFFHMPLFLAVGMFFLRPLSGRETGKAARAILLPYAFWFLLWSLGKFQLAFFTHLPERLTALAMGDYAHLQTPLWFLPALFSLRLLYSVVLLVWSRLSSGALIGVATLLGCSWAGYFLLTPTIAVWHVAGYIPFGLDIAFYLLPFAFFLQWAYRNGDSIPHPLLVVPVLLVAGHSLIVSFEPLKTVSAYPALIDLAQYSMPYTVAGLLGMTAMSCGILLMFLRIPAQLRLMRGLAFLGRYTIAIYVMHLFVLQGVEKVGRIVITKLHISAGGSADMALVIAAIVAAILLPLMVSRFAGRLWPRLSLIGLNP